MLSSNNSFTLRAPAKINLYLHVTGKRDDGYHLLDSLVVFAEDISDNLTFTHADEFSLTIDGPFKDVVPEDNLVTKAVRMIETATGRIANLHIHLQKNIPAGAGLGGGSADAAAVIRGLEKFWDATLESKLRDDILLKLGADVPVCYRGIPSRFLGIGEVIHAAPPLPPLSMIVLCPDSHSATKDVFSARKNTFSKPAEISDDLRGMLNRTYNDLQDAAEQLSPAIKTAREFLQAQAPCFLARMSGSGSSVFGLFESPEEAEKTAVKAQKSYPAWFVRTCRI